MIKCCWCVYGLTCVQQTQYSGTPTSFQSLQQPSVGGQISQHGQASAAAAGVSGYRSFSAQHGASGGYSQMHHGYQHSSGTASTGYQSASGGRQSYPSSPVTTLYQGYSSLSRWLFVILSCPSYGGGILCYAILCSSLIFVSGELVSDVHFSFLCTRYPK